MWGKNLHLCEVELQVEIDESTVIIEELNTPLLEKNRFSRQEIGKDIVDLNSTVNQLDLTNIYKNFIQQQNSHMKHSPRCTTFCAIKRTITNIKQVIQRIFSDYKEIKTRKPLQIAGKSQNV